jgi:hypothetical protein
MSDRRRWPLLLRYAPQINAEPYARIRYHAPAMLSLCDHTDAHAACAAIMQAQTLITRVERETTDDE